MENKKQKGHIIKEVRKNSIAMELEIEPGDKLLAISGQEIEDIFDYQYYIEDEYIEEGYLDDIPYQWTITSYFNQIHQHFAFYCDNSVLQEQHVQYVFDSNEVIDYLKQKGFKVKVYTDFVLDGIQNGEKIFIVGEKIC